jgi:signal transduction histidine kinase
LRLLRVRLPHQDRQSGGSGLRPKQAPAAIVQEDLAGRIRWFISLRWLAAAGLGATITVARFLFGLQVAVFPLYLGVVLVLAYNAVCWLFFRRLAVRRQDPDWRRRAERLANVQIYVDLMLLTYLVYFSGGLENPFIFYYIFHMILSSILLPNRSAYLHAGFAVLLLGGLAAAEALALLPRYPVPGFSAERLTPAVLAGRLGAFATTLFIAVYFTTTIVNRLREREAQLEEQDRLKSRYVMTVSHDIQAGLSAVEGLLMAVLQGFTETVGSKTRELLARASERTHLLLRFVRDLLDLSRLRAEAEIEREQVHLAAVIAGEAELYAEQMRAKQLQFRLDNEAGDPTVNGNRTVLAQLFNNLIGNAVRYTPAGGAVRVALRPAGSDVEVRVEDSGIGIAPEHLERLFEDFFRAPNAKSFSENGTGLGLSIVKQSVRMHGGAVRVESELGRGTRFIVTLPAGA